MRTTAALLLLIATATASAEPVTGPVIEAYGPVYYVPEEKLDWPADARPAAVFDVAGAPDSPADSNLRFETVARYLNMHARAGVDPARLRVAVVVHGRATRSTLNAEVFEERYGEPNPDTALLRALQEAGVRIMVCGQSATAFGFSREELAPGIEMSLSAMTALVALQTDGYALIPWGAD